MFTLVEIDHIGRGSGDDPPCVGIVRSIEVHPWCSPDVVRHRNHPKFSFVCLGRHAHWYVKHYSISCTP